MDDGNYPKTLKTEKMVCLKIAKTISNHILGLWIWGLFKEPQYPFMLFQLQTEEYALPGEGKDAIMPLTLYAQINHKRDKDSGNVELDAAALNIREIESIKGMFYYIFL